MKNYDFPPVENQTVVVSCHKVKTEDFYLFCNGHHSDSTRNLITEEWEMEGSLIAHIDYKPFLKDVNKTLVNDVSPGCIRLLQCHNVNYKAILKVGNLIQEERMNYVIEESEASNSDKIWIIGAFFILLLLIFSIAVVVYFQKRKRQRRSRKDASAHNYSFVARLQDEEQL